MTTQNLSGANPRPQRPHLNRARRQAAWRESVTCTTTSARPSRSTHRRRPIAEPFGPSRSTQPSTAEKRSKSLQALPNESDRATVPRTARTFHLISFTSRHFGSRLTDDPHMEWCTGISRLPSLYQHQLTNPVDHPAAQDLASRHRPGGVPVGIGESYTPKGPCSGSKHLATCWGK